MYGSSRLGTKDYLSGQHYALWDYTGTQPVVDSVKLNSRQPWYSQEYNDDISYLTTQPWGWTQTGSFYVQRALGLKQYELNNHLGNVQATVTDNPVQQWSGGAWTHNMPALASAYDYYPFGMLMPGRYVSDTSVHCMTISTTQWVTTSTMPERIYCENCSFTAMPYGGTQYSAQPAVSGFDLIVPIGGGLDIELTVEPGVQNTFTFDVTQLSSNALARFAVLEDSLGTLRELASELITHRGGSVIKFNPTGNTVIFHVSNEDLYNILVINIVEWYKSKTTTTQETILVEVCDEDKDRYRFGFNGQEKVNEWAGIGNFLDFTLRGYNSQTGRFNGIDPLTNKYPYWSPFQFAGNSPIRFKDLEGAEPYNPVTQWLMTEGMLSVVTKPESAKAKVTGVAIGVGSSVKGFIDGMANIFTHPVETVKGMAPRSPESYAVDMGITMAGRYGDLPEPVQNYAAGANVGTDMAIMLLPFKFKSKGAVQTGVAADMATIARLPKRLVRVVEEKYGNTPTLGRAGEADVFVTTPDALKGLNAEGIAKKLTLKNADGSLRKGPFKLIEFDAPTESLAQPINRSNPGFVEGGKTAGGATEYTIPNMTISELKNVSETTVK